MPPSISILFPIYNRWPQTRKCLNSIKKLVYPGQIEIIITDNASQDHSQEKIKKIFPKTHLIKNNQNLGFAKAINQATQKAKGKFILITNNDLVFDPNCLRELVKTLLQSPQIGAVSGQVTTPNGRLSIDGFKLNPYLGYHQFNHRHLEKEKGCDWISGHCLLIRKKTFQNLGGFDENFFFYFEDVDLSLRLRRAGFKLAYNPQALATHEYAQTIFQRPTPEIFFFHYQSRFYCLFKNASPLQKISSLLFLTTLAPLYQSFLTRSNIFSPMLKGLIWAIKTNNQPPITNHQ